MLKGPPLGDPLTLNAPARQMRFVYFTTIVNDEAAPSIAMPEVT